MNTFTHKGEKIHTYLDGYCKQIFITREYIYYGYFIIHDALRTLRKKPFTVMIERTLEAKEMIGMLWENTLPLKIPMRVYKRH